MSINRNRAKLNKAKTKREYKIINYDLTPYDEGCYTCHHGDYYNHKWREYKTWKHNRKTRWK